MTIRVKLILWYAGLLAIIIVLFGASLYAVTRFVLVESVDTTLRETADQVLQNSRAGMVREFGGAGRVRIFLPELDIFRASGVFVQVWEFVDGEASLAGASSNLSSYQQPLDRAMLEHQQQLSQSRTGGLQDVYTVITVSQDDYRVLSRPLEIWGRRIVIQTATSFETVTQASRGILVILVISMVMALVGSSVLGAVLSYRAMKPIVDITRAAQQIVVADDLKRRLPWNGPMDEIGRLVSVLNQMLQRLEHLFSVQQRFVADVSHELRTPLTAIRGNMEIIERYGADPDSIEAIDKETARMSRLVNDLLLLARADYGGITLERHPVDLDELLGEVYREAKLLTQGRDLTIRMGEFEPIRVMGDADRLKQLLLNLVGNAIKFTPDGGTVTLSLRGDQANAVLEVRDTGIGIQAQDIPRVFDRFYQADSSRARQTGEGAGLGLSIAKWIAEAHGGKIEVESTTGKGSVFRVTLRRSDAPTVVSAAVTRPRLAIIRRGQQVGK